MAAPTRRVGPKLRRGRMAAEGLLSEGRASSSPHRPLALQACPDGAKGACARAHTVERLDLLPGPLLGPVFTATPQTDQDSPSKGSRSAGFSGW